MQSTKLNTLTAERLAALPVANENMSKAQLRQLCIDFFEIQLSFQWIPDIDITDWQFTNLKTYPQKTLMKNSIYGGIPYQSRGKGNMYRWLEYMDGKTGVFNFEKALSENGGYGEGAAVIDVKTDENGKVTYKKYRSFLTLFNQCSCSSFWGWGRVINSANFYYTAHMTVRNGFIPVGCYTYPNAETIDQFGVKSDLNPDKLDTINVINYWNEQKGPMAMYECYAKMKPADCVVSAGHTMMIRSVDVKRDENGVIDINESTVHTLEQIEAWGTQSTLYGKEYKVQGRTDYVYTFKNLLDSTYIPYTFAELLDPDDPQDKEHLDYYYSYADKLPLLREQYSAFDFSNEELKSMTGVGVEKARVFNTLGKTAGELTLEEFKNMTVGANYPISDVFITAFDKDGKVILKNIHRAPDCRTRQVAMSAQKSTWEQDENGSLVPISAGLEKALGRDKKVTVVLQLSTGEKLTAFCGSLTE